VIPYLIPKSKLHIFFERCSVNFLSLFSSSSSTNRLPRNRTALLSRSLFGRFLKSPWPPASSVLSSIGVFDGQTIGFRLFEDNGACKGGVEEDREPGEPTCDLLLQAPQGPAQPRRAVRCGCRRRRLLRARQGVPVPRPCRPGTRPSTTPNFSSGAYVPNAASGLDASASSLVQAVLPPSPSSFGFLVKNNVAMAKTILAIVAIISLLVPPAAATDHDSYNAAPAPVPSSKFPTAAAAPVLPVGGAAPSKSKVVISLQNPT
jgi:hypothetical protein